MKFPKKILMVGVLLFSTFFFRVSLSAAPLKLDAQGHLGFPGNPPALNACSNVASVEGTDNAGRITFSASNPFAGCQLTFSQPYLSPPSCVVSWSDDSVHRILVITFETGFSIVSDDILAGDVYYHCDAL